MGITKASPEAVRSSEEKVIASGLDGRSLGGLQLFIGFKREYYAGTSEYTSGFRFAINVIGQSSTEKIYSLRVKFGPEPAKPIVLEFSQPIPKEGYHQSIVMFEVNPSTYPETRKFMDRSRVRPLEMLAAAASLMWKVECDADSGDPERRMILHRIITVAVQAQESQITKARR